MQHIPEPVSCSDAKEPDKKKKDKGMNFLVYWHIT